MTSDSHVTRPDETGPETILSLAWEKATVPLEAIERALYALADQATGVIRDASDSWILTAHPCAANANVTTMAHRFRQEVNDQALRIKIAERTDSVRKLVFALAFSRSGLVVENDANATSDERPPNPNHTPTAGAER